MTQNLPAGSKVTHVSMSYTDGHTTVLRVYRAVLRGTKAQYINMNAPTTKEIAAHVVTGDIRPKYFELAATYATEEYPVCPWHQATSVY